MNRTPEQITISGPWLPLTLLGFGLLGAGASLRWGVAIALVVGAALIVLVFAVITVAMLVAVRVRRDRR
jgi:hypothetical protein